MSRVQGVKQAAAKIQKICKDIINEEDHKELENHYNRLERQRFRMRTNLNSMQKLGD